MIKIFGERNTGTNYLSKLIKLNFDNEILKDSAPRLPLLNKNEFFKDLFFKYTQNKNLGWKHSFVSEEFIGERLNSSDIKIIFLVKNPYSFLLSLHKRPYHNEKSKNLTFQKFLTSSWKTVGRENYNAGFSNPTELWTKKSGAYLSVTEKYPKRTMIIKYEDVVTDPKSMLTELATFLGVEFDKNRFVNVTKSTKNDSKSFKDYAKYYIEEQWKSKLTSENLESINSFLDNRVLSELDYKKIEPNE